MTDEMMNLRALVEKSTDANVLGEMIGFAAERLMELEVGAATGSGYGEKSLLRTAQRNGYRDRDWETRAGTIEVHSQASRLEGVKLVVSDAHEGLKAAVTKVLSATWQRYRVHFMRNVLAHAGKSGRRVVSAFIATVFAQDARGSQCRIGAMLPTRYGRECQSSPPSWIMPKKMCSPT